MRHTAANDTPLSVYREYEKGHGRHTHWSISVFEASHHPKTKQWQGLKRFVQVERCGIRDKEPYTETAFYISNWEESRAEYFHEGIRGRWHIENRLHWVKDVVHGEDGNKIKKGNAPVNASIFSTIAINIHRLQGHPSISEGQIKFASNVKELINLIRT